MAYILPVGLGVVAGVFFLIVMGEVFYLFYWRKRPLAYPRVNNVTVAPVNEGESMREGDRGREMVIDVTCAEYQISALHQDLVEKLFPSLGASADSAHALLGPPRMLFTITEETKEELEGLDLDGKGRTRRSSRSKSMSDISLSPLGPLSPLSTPFITPLSSPDPFSTPYGTPTYSPLVSLNRSLSASPVFMRTSCRIMYDYSSSPPPAPPSPTRPSFPFLARPASPRSTKPLNQVSPTQEMLERSPDNIRLSPNATFYSPPNQSFMFATTSVHSKQTQSLSKTACPLRPCTYVYENGAFSPSSPSSPQNFPSTFLLSSPGPQQSPGSQQLDHQHSGLEIQEHYSPSSSPAYASSIDLSTPLFFPNGTPPSDTVVFNSPGSSLSCCKPSSQRSSSMLFSSSHPFLCPAVTANQVPAKSAVLAAGPSSAYSAGN